ncbi:MAG TPA: amidohydrolase family protein [Chloroflexota bacterium]|jgi:predicted TIM-barrel fold metal-dependent hydrolase|nr:amidohydrolase family protein [Chloroflexota bacterium]
MTIPIDNLAGIDVHVHITTGDRARAASDGNDRTSAALAYFKIEKMHASGDEIAELYESLNLAAVIFDVDSETHGGARISNDETAEAVRRHPEVLIGFASVDPWKGELAIKEARRCVEDLGLKGFKFHPPIQAFEPSDPRFFPLFSAISALHVPAIFHTGMSGIGAGTPGGSGIHLRYGQPMLLDDLAVEFPELIIIGAHPSWPWQEEMLAIARHKSNVYLDMSGWAPKYFPPSLVQQANSLLQNKCLFGSDFPVISPERWLQEFAELSFKETVRPKILKHNAAQVLGLR